MKQPDHDSERALQRLFDATGHCPEQHRLDTLARHAAQLPQQHPSWRRRWAARWPLVLSVAAMVTAVVVLWWPARAPSGPHPGRAVAASQARENVPSGHVPAWQPSDDDDAFAVLGEQPGAALSVGDGARSAALFEGPFEGLAWLSVSEGDTDLDAVEAALDALLEGG
ncbi:MAG TPA: hypothetical protein ENK23_00860 [Sorangium sp.]|nr:hypothetical protein [Sorangium sp.]